MHLIDLSVNFLGTTPIVASIIPIAVGTAFSTMMKNEKRVTVVFLGRAATEEGVFTESLNFASLKNLPVIFIAEDNLFSVYTALSERQPKNRDNADIAQAYGIPAAKGNGNDILEVYIDDIWLVFLFQNQDSLHQFLFHYLSQYYQEYH